MHKKIVLFCRRDAAGKNIAAALRKKDPAAEVAETEESILYLDDSKMKADVCVVASRHKSESETPTLTTHPPGNFGDAAFGGEAKTLGIAPAHHLHMMLLFLKEEKEKRKLAYEVSLEATHHGPTSLPYPILFAEVGSSIKQWNDLEACDAVAEAIWKVLASEPEKLPAAVGFGGGHYCRKFSEVTEYALGHICPKHSLGLLDEDLIWQMVEKTVPKPEVALVEKKGLGAEKEKVMRLLEDAFSDIVRI